MLRKFRCIFIVVPILLIVLFCSVHIAEAAVVNQTITNRINDGLVGYWTLDGGDMLNGTVLDRTTQANHGKLANIATSTFFKPGKIGQAGKFDGVNDWVSIADNILYDNTTTLTVAAWVKYDLQSSTLNGVIVSKTRGVSGFGGWALNRNASEEFEFRISDGSTSATPQSKVFADTNWHHVVGVYNGTDIRVYVDGVLDGGPTAYTSALIDDTRPVCIGTTQGGSAVCTTSTSVVQPMMIDDVRIYNRALSAAEVAVLYAMGNNSARVNNTITTNAGLNSGLLAYWTFDGRDISSSGVVLDRSGNGNTGNPKNIATSTFYAPGKIGQGFNFDGTNDSVATKNLSMSTGAITVSAWVQKNLNGTQMNIVHQCGSGSTNKSFELINRSVDKFQFTVYGTDGSSEDHSGGSATFTTLGKWYHVVATYNGSAVNMYVDGVSQGSVAYAGTLQTAATQVTEIGTGVCKAGLWRGKIDDVHIYNRALSPAEIQTLYTIGNVATKINTSLNTRPSLKSGLVGHWTFDGPDILSGVVLDKSGNGNHGNPLNIATSTFYRPGKIGQGGNFIAVNSNKVKIQGTSLLDLPVFTFVAWIKLASYGSSQVGKIVSTEGNSVGGWFISSGNNNNRRLSFGADFDGGDLTAGTGGSTILTNKWTHIAVSWDGTTSASGVHIYIDGVESPLALLTDGIGTRVADTAFNIGGTNIGSARFVDGLVDDVRMYNRILTAAEISQLYSLGK